LKQILWGLFKKMVIADNCGQFADLIFSQSESYHGSTLLLGAFFFAMQIYGDFSGYSDMAVGLSRLFGFDLMQNFSFPYFSRSIAEFWRRWHISLSTWFRDYLYIPLGGNKKGKAKTIRNTFITFLVSGLWHGAHLKYLAWGGLHALYMLPHLLKTKTAKRESAIAPGKFLPGWKEGFSILFTFILVLLAWIFFRANSLAQADQIFSEIFSRSMLTIPQVLPRKILVLLVFFLLFEWRGRNSLYAIEKTGSQWPIWTRWLFYYFILLLIFLEGGREQPFIYFQF